ncbi:RHS repeat-associated core domain-containing protein [Myceligenerans indicum]|uniref:Teneurin-like YD-shell domain-containing protein n=1 Tax=Myceligenerans indicum TaxID=2593663 RepID=A0ABS1LR31_9MICO|nr:RHS repeat-associated core domain-containing protein [Myceligenerans indicum]MBL0888715.1 hypothetical protein [Myceligenerans indicum]
MSTVLIGVDPASAAPVVGQIVALEAAAAAEVDALEARSENFTEVLAQLGSEDPVVAQDLTAPEWEPTPDPSEVPPEDLPAETLPPVADDPGGEGSSEPVEDVPTGSTSTMSLTETALASSKLDAASGDLDQSGTGSELKASSSLDGEASGDPAASSEASGDPAASSSAEAQDEGVASATADLAAGEVQVEVDGVEVSVSGESEGAGKNAKDARGGVRVAAASVEPGGSGGVPGLLVRVEAAAVDAGQKADGKQRVARSGAAADAERVAPADGVVDVRVDYASLVEGGQVPGGDWASRLTLVDVSGCDADELASGGCQAEPVEGVSNDADAQTLMAPMAVSQEATTLMVAASASGGGGDWGATSLAPAASWEVNSDFAWSYPLTMPSVAGPSPQLSLSYSSAASDGRIASTNNQAGAVGEGWSLAESFIERKFASCSEDQDPVDGQEPNNASHTTGDMCIDEDNATMSLDGQAVDLVKTADGTWRPKTIDGTKVERKTGASNGDQEGEYWLVTTADGTKYTFGRGERASDGLKTGSSWTMPVYGNHPGEACYKSSANGGFAASKCRQTYRWMLDHVVEPTGGTMTYVYSTETRRYGHNLSEGTSTYTAGGFLKRILYGTRTSTEGSGPAPVRVDLEHSTRCVPGTGVNCDAGRVKENLSAWPDAPGDLVCYKSDSECGVEAISPSFYSLYRLARVTTRVHDGSSYKPVDSWRLDQSFISPGDGSLGDGNGKVLWLRSIQHTGHGGTASTGDDLSNNKVVFAWDMLPNRVDTGTDGLPPMYRPRVTGVRTESGGVISPNYRTECAPGDVPADTDAAKRDNTRLCFPVEWRGDNLPIDWFHKYVVTSVTQSGASTSGGGGIVTGSEDVVTRYRYDGGAKWVKPTGPLTDPEEVTWSEYRGFRTVVVTEGDGSQASSTTTRYLRGVDGSTFDVGPAGHRTSVSDHDALSGEVVEVIEHNGSDGEEAVSWEVTDPKTPVTVATGIDGVKATRLAGATTLGYSMDAAGQVATRTRVETTLDAYGQIKQTADSGDLDLSGDETCTKVTYAYAGDSMLEQKNMVALVERTQEFAVSCATVGAGGASRPGDVAGDEYTVYNSLGLAVEVWTVDPSLDRDSGTLGDADGVGYVRAQRMVYDALGRVVSAIDRAGRTTTTSYTPATAPIATQTVTTGPDPDGAGPKTSMTSTTRHDGVTGLTESVTDRSGQTTRGEYDGLGRLVEVTYAQHEGLSLPSVAYEYTTRSNGLNAVVTRTLGADSDGNPLQHAAATLYDGLMRVFQTQTEGLDTGELRQDDAATRGRQITQTFYDSAGRTWKVTSPQFATGLVSNTPVQPDLIAPAATVSSYDGAGRPVDEIFYVGNPDNHLNERWRTVTRYDGKYTTVVAPEGGVARTTVTDALGRTTALWEHKTRPTVDSDTADGHWYVPSTLPGFDPRTLAPSSYRKTTYDFDRFGQMTSVSGPGSGQWTYEYDMGGRKVRVSDPEAGISTTVYDAAGNVARTVNGNGNEVGATQAVVDANTLVYSYDSLDRRTETADGTGLVRARWTYDETPGADGQAVKGSLSSSTRIEDGLEYTSRVEGYDEALRPTATSVVLPELEGLDGLSGRTFTTSTEYRIDGSVRQQVLPAIAQLDETGAVAGTVLGKERVTTFYDDAGKPIWMGGGFGWGTYVADSQFTAKGQPQALDLGTTYGAVVAYDYEHGTERLSGIRLSREQYDGTDLELAYGYDPAGNITSITDQPTLQVGEQSAGGPIVPGAERNDNQCFDYDGLGRLIGAWTDADGTCAASIGDVTAAQVGVAGGSAAPYWQEYTYDAAGNRTSLTEHVLDGSTDVVKTTYEHGGVGPNQVTKAVQATGPEADIDSAPQTTVGQYTYDASGAQTTRTLSEPVDPADPVQVEADTDSDGLLTVTQALGWDTEGELAGVSTSGEDAGGDEEVLAGEAEYVYSAGGDRLVRTDAGGTTVFLPGGQEVTVTDGAVTAVRYYSFAGQMVASRSGNGLGGVTSLVCDHHGSVMASVPNTDWTPDAVTRVYTDPFGGDRTPESVDPETGETVKPADELPGDRRFLGGAGGIDDSTTGLVLLGARYYDTTLGRFISVDPVMDLSDPEQWHGYAYANNNPVTYSDASGLFAVIGPLLDGVWVPKNSSSPAAGKQVAANNTGYKGQSSSGSDSSADSSSAAEGAAKSAGEELEDRVDGDVQDSRANASPDESAEKAVWRSVWDSFHSSSRYFRQVLGGAGTLVSFADYCAQNGCIDEGLNFYRDPAFWLTAGQVANEELWAGVMSAIGAGAGASVGLWAGAALGGGVASLPAGAIGFLVGGAAGAGLGALGGGLLGQNMNAALGQWSRKRGWVD